MAYCDKDSTRELRPPNNRQAGCGGLPALQRQSLGKKACCGEPPPRSGGGADQHLYPQYIQEFTNETWRTRTGQPLPDHLVLLVWSLIVSLYPLGGLLGALLAGPLAVTLGR